jgi:hypothetical protein
MVCALRLSAAIGAIMLVAVPVTQLTIEGLFHLVGW